MLASRSNTISDPASSKMHGLALTVIASGVLIALLYWARVVFITVSIALIIAFILEPFVGFVMRARLPRPVAAFIVCLLAVGVLFLVGFGAWNQLSGIATEAANFTDHFNELRIKVTDRVQNFENSITRLVTPAPAPAPAAPAPQSPAPRRGKRAAATPAPVVPAGIPEVRIHNDKNPIADFIYAQLGTVYEALLMGSFVPILVYFMLSWRDHVYKSFLRLFDEDDRIAATGSMEGITSMARAFVVGNFMIGVLLSIVCWIAFIALDIPYPSVVALSSGFISLLPYVGLAVAVIPPLVAGIGVGASSSTLFFAVITVVGMHLIAMNILYPKLVGARVHLNPLVVTLSLLFWGFLWDAAGLLLAIPITAGIKAVCDNVDSLKPYARLLGN